MPDDDIIRASEVGEFVYCARAWWLRRVKGLPSAHQRAMQAGTVGHRAHGRAVMRAVWLQRLAVALLLLALLALAAWLLIGWGG